jgi:hypothetical protein
MFNDTISTEEVTQYQISNDTMVWARRDIREVVMAYFTIQS